jgi:hypothetical protein
MDNILRDAVEKRRQKLIRKLMNFDVYKVNQKHLFELTLTELEKEYKILQRTTHPHNGVNSIQWVNHDETEDKKHDSSY